MDQPKMDSAQLVSAFEGSMVEIEVLAKRPFGKRPDGKPACYAIYNVHFDYRSRPELKYQQEGYQRGPIHVGQTIFTLREYVWTPEQVDKYKQFRIKEDFDLLASIDSSVQAAYTALGNDLEKYLKEAGESIGEEWGKKEEPKPKRSTLGGLLDPFIAPFKSNIPQQPKTDKKAQPKKLSKADELEIEDAKKAATGYCNKNHYTFLKRIKATYGFVY